MTRVRVGKGELNGLNEAPYEISSYPLPFLDGKYTRSFTIHGDVIMNATLALQATTKSI